MALPSEAVARYLQILQSDRYRDLAWVAELQDGTRQEAQRARSTPRSLGASSSKAQRARCAAKTISGTRAATAGPFCASSSKEQAEAGRLTTPLLMPHFLPKSQFATLAGATERLSAIVEQVYTLALQSSPLLRRLRLLPAERALAKLPPGPIRMSVAAHAEAHIQDGSFVLSGFQSAIAPELASIDHLIEGFAKLPILRDFQLSGFPLSPICSGGHLSQMVLKTWKEFGGKSVPRIAVLQCSDLLSAEEEGLVDLLSRGAGNTCFVRPESLRFTGGRLRSGDFDIDVFFRHVPTRELLLHLELAHPLFEACREGAVCVINSFRSEIVNRRSFFALLTDCTVISRLPACDQKLVYELAPWTRVVAPGKTEFHGTEIDLLEFILKNREQLVLLPNDPAAGLPSFTGAQMTATAWDGAVRTALHSVYVVQERPGIDCEIFPTYQYGNLEMQPAEVTVRPHIFGRKVHGASTVLARTCLGSTRSLAIAPIFLLDLQ